MRKGFALLMAVLLLCLCPAALAHDVPDLSRTGSLKITMRFDGAAVPGGSLTLYRVGEVSEDGGNYSFIPTGDFADCGYAFSDVESAALARALANYAAGLTNPAKTTLAIGSDGAVAFEDLELGLYLLVQQTAAEGYNAAAPFLVTVPRFENGAFVYEVDASPKVELEKAEPTPTPPPTTDDKLPQTGQMNWPVPVMAMSGACLFTVGWTLRFKKEKQ